MQTYLPNHGRIDCSICHNNCSIKFDEYKTEKEGWRISANPLAWGSSSPEVLVLGFSKGPTQAGSLATSPHDEIAFKGGRKAVGKILAHIGLIPVSDIETQKKSVDRIISDRSGLFHFGSLIRCSIERFDEESRIWQGSGSGMLDQFTQTNFGREVSMNCSKRFLSNLPSNVRLVVMFGMGTNGNYIRECRRIIENARPGNWKTINDVAYSDEQVTFVHVEHFAVQGAHLPNWLGQKNHHRSKLGILAKTAVADCLKLQDSIPYGTQ